MIIGDEAGGWVAVKIQVILSLSYSQGKKASILNGNLSKTFTLQHKTVGQTVPGTYKRREKIAHVKV